ncbi:MAG: hypothetical protein Q9168_004661 [Polycauliona sp. 1 TL-2023]
MRSSLFGLLGLAVAATYAQDIKLIDQDNKDLCVLVVIRNGDAGFSLCAPHAVDLSKLAVAGDDITIWAEWDANNKAICGWSAGSLTFQMPSEGGDFVWRENCLEQTETTWRQCTKPVKCSEALGANPYFGDENSQGVCEGNPTPPPGTGCIVGE